MYIPIRLIRDDDLRAAARSPYESLDASPRLPTGVVAAVKIWVEA